MCGGNETNWFKLVHAVSAVQNVLKTSLGPQGLDKMLVNDIGDVTSMCYHHIFDV